VNSVLHLFGMAPVDWFATGTNAFVVIIVMDLWRSAGFYAVLLYAGLVDIPGDVIESARMDGAGGLRLVRHIVLPLSKPILIASIIFAINANLKVFDTILALNNGGPGTATTPLNLYMFQTSFLYSDYGYGSTIAMLITVLGLIGTVLVFRSSRRNVERAA
jgi:multiple sugar transport system permease protein/raffinose/stachyose/melibiose transport system permease protein